MSAPSALITFLPHVQGEAVSPDERVATIAAVQHGVVTAGQALTADLTEHGISHRLRTGRWIRLHRGVYAVAGAPRTSEQHVFAAVASLGEQARAASVTAAWLLSLVKRPGDLVYVLLPAGQHRHGRNGLVIGEAALTRSDIRTVNGIRVTAPNRTLVDLAGVLSERALEAALDDAVLLGLTTVPSLRRYIRERRLEHRPGAGVLRRLLEDRTVGVPQKELEKRFLRKLRASGLPDPVRQHPVGGYFIDFAYPVRRIAIELDSRAHHFSGEAFRTDPRRRNELVLAGWHPFHFTWEDIHDLWPTTEAVLRAALGLPESG